MLTMAEISVGVVRLRICDEPILLTQVLRFSQLYVLLSVTKDQYVQLSCASTMDKKPLILF